MPTVDSGGTGRDLQSAGDARVPARFERQLPPLLSVIAGMVDLTGFVSLGNLFTAHITGNLVVIAALVVWRGRINPAQIMGDWAWSFPVVLAGVAAALR